ncbi:MAG TPA: glycosyltransferase family 4 protein [Solirubrobacteraceae bacterium]
MRALFFNEGNLDSHVLGHGQLDAALRAGLSEAQGVEARFAGLPPAGRFARAAASRHVEPLARLDLDLRAIRWHGVHSLRARTALRRELQAWPADVVHVYSHAIALTMVGIMRSTPVVLSTDTSIIDWSNMPGWRSTRRLKPVMMMPSRLLERRALRNAALVLARTAWTRRGLEREAPGVRVVEHHPGIDLDRYRPADRRERPRPRVLFVGSRFVHKGGEDLLAALEERLGRDVDLDLVTPAEVHERPGVTVHRLEPSDPRLLDLQQQADVCCLPTYGDTNPWSVLEAMACGTPMVSTRIGGIPEMLDEGRAGVIVPYGDPRALGDALRSLLADPQRRSQLAGRARARCEERYDSGRQLMLLLEHLRAVSGGGEPGQGDPRRSGQALPADHDTHVVET